MPPPVVKMPHATHHAPSAAARLTGDPAWIRRVLRALAVLGLLLLPIQLRAGAQHPHPHALLQLLVDMSDGSFDHHTLGEEAASPPYDHAGATETAGTHQPDIPALGKSVSATGGLAVLAALVAALLIPPPPTARIWPHATPWRCRCPLLEPPPPRRASV
jgi:hypothetical protein